MVSKCQVVMMLIIWNGDSHVVGCMNKQIKIPKTGKNIKILHFFTNKVGCKE